MMRSEMHSAETASAAALGPAPVLPDSPSCPFVRHPAPAMAATSPATTPAVDDGRQHSGRLHRPIDEIRRSAVTPETAVTELERFKLAMRRYAPVQRGREALPWRGEWECSGCHQRVAGQFVYDEAEDAMYLETECPTCGRRRERHHDVLFVRDPKQRTHPRQPKKTYSGFPIRPILTGLPRTVETLCPECAALILGRYFVRDEIVWIEKTCPEHGYFRDKINTDVRLYLKGTVSGYEDERGVYAPQVTGARHCPTDCGLCNQHHSASCLPQIDLTNRCNLTCPICFATANQAGYVAEPTYEMVVEMLRSLRNQHPYPATTVQFTGGEPTLHPDFLRLLRTAREMGFSHTQVATNGLKFADREFTEQAAEAGLHTLYMQFDGLDDRLYQRLRGRPLLDLKMQAIENIRRTDMKICLVPTIVKTINDDQVGPIFRFACRNADVISAISYQPVSFTGRIHLRDLERQRYTLGDLAHDIAAASGADLMRDFWALNFITPISRVSQTLDGKPKIRTSCHSDCAFGTYFFVSPEGEPIPVAKVFDMGRLMNDFNEFAARVQQKRPDGKANRLDRLYLAWLFFKRYRWFGGDYRVTPVDWLRALRGLTNKQYGRGSAGKRTYRTLMAAGMHFMDRYNFDTERIRRCGILYSTVDGMYPFCTINCGPVYRPYIEAMYARPLQPGD
jgi:uncharacterized radical SAM superfamily Fe-S cluster-containing enzyme